MGMRLHQARSAQPYEWEAVTAFCQLLGCPSLTVVHPEIRYQPPDFLQPATMIHPLGVGSDQQFDQPPGLAFRMLILGGQLYAPIWRIVQYSDRRLWEEAGLELHRRFGEYDLAVLQRLYRSLGLRM